MLFRTDEYETFFFSFFNSRNLLFALTLEVAITKNLKSASGTILYVMSLPSKQEPLNFFGGL